MTREWGKRTLFAGLAAFAVMLTACGQGAATTGAETEGSGGNDPIRLKVSWWGSQARHDVTLKAFEMYGKLRPEITFEPIFSGFDEYWDKLSTQAAAKNAPDIIQMDAAYLADYVGRNQLAELSDFDTSGIDQTLLDAGMIDGKLYAIALGMNARGMVYNKAEVQRLGITPPAPGWTWDDYFAFAEEAKSKLGEGKYGILDNSRDRETYEHYQLSQGKGHLFEDGKFHLDKATWVEWMSKFQELRDKGLVPPAEMMSTDKELDAQFDLLANGTVLARPLHAAQPGALDSLIPGQVGVVNAPSDGGWLKPTFFFTVSEHSAYKEEAKAFIRWFLTDVEAGEMMGTQRGVPVIEEVQAKVLPTLSPADLLGKEMIDMTADHSQSFVPPPMGWTEFLSEYEVAAEAVMYGKMTIEEGYEKLVQKANEIQDNLDQSAK